MLTGNDSISHEIPPELLRFHDAEWVVGIISLLTNATLLYLICFRTPRELRDYQPFIFAITLADFSFDVLVILIIRPVMLFPAIAAIITGPVKALGSETLFYLGALGVFMFVYCMFSINLAFLYCYVCIAHKRAHRFFVTKKTQLLLHLATIGTCICALIYPFSQRLGCDELSKWLEGQNVIPQLNGHFDQFVMMAVDANLGVICNIALIFLPCLLNALLAYLIVRKLRSFRSSFTATTYKMHIRLAACLLCQTFCPAFLLAFPIALLIGGWLLNAQVEYYRQVASGFIFTLACHPLVNALCTLFFVRPYRRHLIKDRWIRFVKAKMGFKITRTESWFAQTRAPVSIVVMEFKERLERRRTMASDRRKSIIHPSIIQLVGAVNVESTTAAKRNQIF